jgi:predicted metal-dependent peptidase
MSSEDKLEIAASIEDYHKVFFTFFELSDVVFDDSIPTAAVWLPRKGKAEMKINQDFWDKLTFREQLFVVCHECMHVILDHGIRDGMNVPGATPKLVNIAQDITINEMICDLFNYDRNDIREWKKYCWIDTCFENPILIKRNETFTYYLEELIKNPPPNESAGGPGTVDEHDDGTMTEEEKQARADMAATLAEDMSVAEIEKIIKSLPPDISGKPNGLLTGTLIGVLEHIIAKKIKKLKVKFAHIIRKLKKTSMKQGEKDVETFTHDSRRFDDVIRSSKASLPGVNAVLRPEQDRLLTAVFMDISGSCLPYLDVFQKVFLAFDEERKIFDTRLFIFDTVVKAVKPGDHVHIGGGTNFAIIEEECQKLQKDHGRYPDCVVVITDGYGTPVKPKAPTKWIFLLTPKESTPMYVPQQSKHFDINQITFD